MAQAKDVPANGLVDLTKILGALGPLIFGTGTTKASSSQTQQGSVSPQANSQMEALLAALMPQVTGTAQADNVVNNIFTRARQSFAPTLGKQRQAGLYNSTTVKQMADEAIARATAESAQAVLQSQQQAAQTASGLVNNNIQATKSTTTSGSTSQETAPVVNPAVSGATAAALIAKSFLMNSDEDKKKRKKSPVESAGGAVASSVGGPGLALNEMSVSDFLTAGGFTAPDPTQQLISSIGLGGTADPLNTASIFTGGIAGSDLGFEAGSSILDLASAAAGGAGDFASAAGDFALDTFGQGAVDAIAELGSDPILSTISFAEEGATLLSDLGEELFVEGASGLGDLAGIEFGMPWLTAINLFGSEEVADIEEIQFIGDSIGQAISTIGGDLVKGVGSFFDNFSDCYITTAAYIAQQGSFDDSSDELQTLRAWRDTVVSTTAEGRADIAEYYRTAPEIVHRISRLPGATQIFQAFYTGYILPTVAAVKAGNLELARKTYDQLVYVAAKIAGTVGTEE